MILKRYPSRTLTMTGFEIAILAGGLILLSISNFNDNQPLIQASQSLTQ